MSPKRLQRFTDWDPSTPLPAQPDGSYCAGGYQMPGTGSCPKCGALNDDNCQAYMAMVRDRLEYLECRQAEVDIYVTDIKKASAELETALEQL